MKVQEGGCRKAHSTQSEKRSELGGVKANCGRLLFGRQLPDSTPTTCINCLRAEQRKRDLEQRQANK